MDDVITIAYPNGEMQVCLSEFFRQKPPMTKLLKVVELDFQNRDNHYDDILSFLRSEIETFECLILNYKIKAPEYHQKAVDAFKMLESGKHPNGVPLSKEELENVKESYQRFKWNEKETVRSFKCCTEKKKQFQKYIETIEKRK